MRRFRDAVLSFAAVLTVCCFSACSDDNGGEIPPPTIDPVEQGFDLEVTNEDYESVEISVTPTLLDVPYIYLVIPAREYEALGSDEALVANDLRQIDAIAEQRQLTREELLGTMLVQGRKSHPVTGLQVGTAYYLYAYGMTTSGEATTAVWKKSFSTRAVDPVDCSFDVTSSSTRTAVRVDVKPSDQSQAYYYQLLDDDRYRELGGTPETASAALLKQQIDAWLALGAGSVASAVESITLKGDHGADFTGLEAGREYHLVVFGVNTLGYVCTEVFYRSVPTEAFAMSDNRIALTVGSVTWDSAEVAVSVTNDDPYLAVVKPASELAGKSDEEIMREIVGSYGESVESRTHRGAWTLVCDKTLMPDTDYVALAFGYYGGATTALVREAFTTMPEGQTGGVTFTFTLKGDDQVTVTPSDPSVLYLWGSIAEDTYQGYGATPAGLRGHIQALMEAYIPDVYGTPGEYVLGEGVRGKITEDHWIWAGDGQYRFYAVCMNPDGTFAAEPVVSEIFTF